MPNSHPILADERIKRRLGDQVFTSGKSYQAMPETNADCQKVQRWSMYSTTFCLRSRRMWPPSYRPSCPCPRHQRTALRQLRRQCLLLRNPRCFGLGKRRVAVLDRGVGYAFCIVAILHVSIEGSLGHGIFGGDLSSPFYDYK